MAAIDIVMLSCFWVICVNIFVDTLLFFQWLAMMATIFVVVASAFVYFNPVMTVMYVIVGFIFYSKLYRTQVRRFGEETQ